MFSCSECPIVQCMCVCVCILHICVFCGRSHRFRTSKSIAMNAEIERSTDVAIDLWISMVDYLFYYLRIASYQKRKKLNWFAVFRIYIFVQCQVYVHCTCFVIEFKFESYVYMRMRVQCSSVYICAYRYVVFACDIYWIQPESWKQKKRTQCKRRERKRSGTWAKEI